MKRTIFALASLAALALTSCLDNKSKNNYKYEAQYLFMPQTSTVDTTFIHPDYAKGYPKSADLLVDTIVGRHLLNKKLMFDKVYSAEGEDMLDVDTQLRDAILVDFKAQLDAVKAIDYAAVLDGVDSVIAGKVWIMYDVKNTSTNMVVMRDTITQIEIVKE